MQRDELSSAEWKGFLNTLVEVSCDV